MKIMKCYDCDHEMSAEDRDSMLKEMYNHYMSEHKDIITGASDDEKKAWMAQFDTDWVAA